MSESPARLAPQGTESRLSPRLRTLVLLAVALSLILCAYSAYHRTPWSDEGWFSSASYNLAKRGFMGTTVMETAGTPFTRIDQRTYWVMPLFLLGQAAWYVLFPSDLFWTRMFTILWVPFTLGAYYLFLRKLLGAVTAAWACILLALTYHFIDNGGFARPDLMCMGLGMAGLAVYVIRREQSFLSAFFLGNVCVALSIFTHPNGLYHFTALGVLVLVYDWRRLSVTALAAGAAPYLALGAAWGVYAMQDTEAFREQLRANGTNSRWTHTLNPFAILVNEIRDRYFPAYGLVTRGSAIVKMGALVAYLAGIAGVLSSRELRGRREVRIVCLLLLTYFCTMSVFNQKLSFYLIHIIPFYVAVLTIWLHWLWERFPRLRLAVVGAAGLLVAVECSGIVLRAVQRSYMPALRPAAEFVKSRTGPNDRIAGTAALVYEFGFTDRLRDDAYLGLRSGHLPDVIIIENLYEIAYSYWKDERPEDMRRIRERLASYQLVYDHNGYQVYVKPS
jgi:4-amino-4-deoxy-L-arabinose transferase-like glycosyltransferase